MNTRLIATIMFLLSLACCSFGQSVHQIAVPDANGYPRVVDSAHPLPVDADVSIGSVSVNVFPVFADGSGNPATATVDTSNRAVVAIGADSSGIVDAVKQCSEWDEQVVSLTANTAATFTTEISGSRRFVELTAQDTDIEFWVSIGGTAAVNGCRPVNGSIYIEVPKTVIISLIASEAVKISIVEGGY